jgi:hypothetical protein
VISSNSIKKLVRECAAEIPTTGTAFPSDYTSAALNAGAAVVESLRACLDEDPCHAIEAGALARETIFMFVDSRTTEDLSLHGFSVILGHPLMEREVKAQVELLARLAAISAPSEELIGMLISPATAARCLLDSED